jgi:hypothetical protein
MVLMIMLAEICQCATARRLADLASQALTTLWTTWRRNAARPFLIELQEL